MNKPAGIKIILKNKRAFFDFLVSEKWEAGISLKGTEVKSLRSGKGQMTESFVTIDSNQEVWVHNLRIPHYEFGNINNHGELRKRKLLLHAKEIKKLKHAIQAKGFSLIPLKLYFKSSLVKLEIGLGKGKQAHDKRQDQAKKDVQRKLQRGQYD